MGAQHDVIMRAYHRRTDNALVNRVSTQHLDTARELLNHLDEALAEAQHAWPNLCDGKELPAPQADASLPLRPGRGLTPVDGEGGDAHQHARQRIFRRSSPLRVDEGLIENPHAHARVCLGLASDGPTFSSSEVITDCQEGLQ